MGMSTVGHPRALTDAQVTEVLDWYKQYRDVNQRRRALKSKEQLAADIGVSPPTINYIIAQGLHYRAPDPAQRTRGRPPIISDPATRARVHAWHAERLQINALRQRVGTFEEIAQRFDVVPSVIWRIVQAHGAYKQISPEMRAQEVARRRNSLDALPTRFSCGHKVDHRHR
jgi:hypothetical protein